MQLHLLSANRKCSTTVSDTVPVQLVQAQFSRYVGCRPMATSRFFSNGGTASQFFFRNTKETESKLTNIIVIFKNAGRSCFQASLVILSGHLLAIRAYAYYCTVSQKLSQSYFAKIISV